MTTGVKSATTSDVKTLFIKSNNLQPQFQDDDSLHLRDRRDVCVDRRFESFRRNVETKFSGNLSAQRQLHLERRLWNLSHGLRLSGLPDYKKQKFHQSVIGSQCLMNT